MVHLVIHSSVSPKFWNEYVNSDYKTASWQPWLHHTQCESKLITTKHNRCYGVSSGNSFWLCESKRFMFRRYVFLLRMWPKSYYIDQKNIQIILNRRSFLIFCFFIMNSWRFNFYKTEPLHRNRALNMTRLVLLVLTVESANICAISLEILNLRLIMGRWWY